MHAIELKLSASAFFLNDLFHRLNQDKVEVELFVLDHLCYRVDSEKKYQITKKILSLHANLLVESEINGRQIATFKLFEPICFQEREIFLVELPAPKKGSPYSNGWEHIEFVISSPLEDFLRKYKHLNFDKSGFLKKLNRDVRLTYGSFSVKFHELSLEEVIQIECQSTNS